MATLSAVDIGKHAYAAGFTEREDLREAIAYALAASNGKTDAKAAVPSVINAEWDSRIGLWQIRSRKAEQGKGTQRDRNKLLDPLSNAVAIYAITNGGRNWDELSAVAGRRYLAYPFANVAANEVISGKGNWATDAIGGANDAARGADGSVTDKAADAVGAAGDALSDIATAVRATAGWFGDRNNTIRIGKGLIGAALVIGAVYVVTQQR